MIYKIESLLSLIKKQRKVKVSVSTVELVIVFTCVFQIFFKYFFQNKDTACASVPNPFKSWKSEKHFDLECKYFCFRCILLSCILMELHYSVEDDYVDLLFYILDFVITFWGNFFYLRSPVIITSGFSLIYTIHDFLF